VSQYAGDTEVLEMREKIARLEKQLEQASYVTVCVKPMHINEAWFRLRHFVETGRPRGRPLKEEDEFRKAVEVAVDLLGKEIARRLGGQ
jgi:hypothetical protein